MDGTYTIEIDSPLGRKQGKVSLRAKGDTVMGDIDAPVIGKQHVEGQREGEDSFVAQGTFKLLLMGKIAYSLRGKVTGDDLHISIKSSKGDFELQGHRI